MDNGYRIFSLGDGAMTLDFGNEISEQLNDRAVALAARIEAKPFRGLIETIPAYSSVTIIYDLARVRRSFPEHETAFGAVSEVAVEALGFASADALESRPAVEIPVVIDEASSPDLANVAMTNGLSEPEVLSIFFGRTYRVYMLGFLPGFAYMGEVDARIATPRHSEPRTSVPKGSVGIAGRQTGIYSLSSPGGWQIIGRTTISLFTPESDTPCLLRPGDRVKFVRAA